MKAVGSLGKKVQNLGVLPIAEVLLLEFRLFYKQEAFRLIRNPHFRGVRKNCFHRKLQEKSEA